MSIKAAYMMLEQRRTVILEMMPESNFFVRIHRDIRDVILHECGQIGLRPLRLDPQGAVFADCHYPLVEKTLRCHPLSNHLKLRVRTVAPSTWLAREQARSLDISVSETSVQNRHREAFARLENTGLMHVLKNHQLQFIEWALLRQRVLCADDMGLGKTLQ